MTIVENKYIWYYKKVETTTIQYYNFYFQEGKRNEFLQSIAEKTVTGRRESVHVQQAQQSTGADTASAGI